MKRFLLTLVSFLSMSGAFAQQKTLDIPGIHLLVHQSITENKLQVKARDQQAAASANEQANLTLLARLKATYRTLQRRYNTLGTVINLADIGIYATPVVERIISNQKSIITLAEKNPALIATGYRSEIQFAEKAKSLAGYVAGLVVSIGDINQMKASDRKMLFDYVLSELNSIAELSANMVNLLQYSNAASLLKAANPFQDFIDADKAVASQIIQNAKYLK